MTRYTAAAAGLVLAFVAGCDSDPTAPTLVVASNTTLATNPAVAQAIAGTTFNFPGGAAAISTETAGQNLALTFTNANAATMVFTNAAGATTGTITTSVTYGSCIFVVSASTFPTGHRLAQGNTVVVNPCNINVNTAGQQATGVSATRSVALLLGSAASAGAAINVSVNPGGQLTLNGISVGTVTLVPVSG